VQHPVLKRKFNKIKGYRGLFRKGAENRRKTQHSKLSINNYLLHPSHFYSCSFFAITFFWTSASGSDITVTNSKFGNNNRHIYISNATGTATNNTFGELNQQGSNCTGNHIGAYTGSDNPMVFLENCTGVSANNNTFTTLNTNNAFDIKAIQVHNCTQLNINGNSDNGFLNSGITLISGTNNNVNTNTFEFKLKTAQFGFTTRSAWTKNGIVLINNTAASVNNNLIEGAESGIQFYQNTNTPLTVSSIEKNRFESCTYGLVTATKENPATAVAPYQNSSTQTVYVNVGCNTFNNGDYGWVGTGKYLTQGSFSFQSGNSFNNVNNWNACVTGFGSIYYFDNPVTNENPYGVLNNTILDGVLIDNSNYTNLCFATSQGSGNGCTGRRSNSIISNVDIEDEKEEMNDILTKVKVINYPNPFDNQMIIEVKNTSVDAQINIQVVDLNGKLIYQSSPNLANVDKIVVNLNNLAAGMYLLQVYDRDKILHTDKVVKMLK